MFHDLKSRKFVVAILAAILIVANDALGKPVSDEAMYSALGLIGTYILGQGIADHGAQGAATAARRAVNHGVRIEAAVRDVLGMDGVDEAPVDDDGPNWEDTTEVDPEDKKELLG